jgi:hypothetical protein
MSLVGTIRDAITGAVAKVNSLGWLHTQSNAGPNSNFFLEAGKGNLTGYAPIFFVGESESITATESTLMARGGVYVFPSVAAVIDIVSSSANDTAAGTGAQSVVVFGLDANYDEIAEVIPTNGTTISTGTLLFLRVNGFTVATHGTDNINVGDINASHGANIISQIEASAGTSRQAVQTVPAGHTWFPQGNHFSCGKSDEIVAISGGRTPTGLKVIFSKVYLYQDQFPFRNENMVPFPEKFDIAVSATRFSGTSAKIAVFTQFFEVKNTEY